MHVKKSSALAGRKRLLSKQETPRSLLDSIAYKKSTPFGLLTPLEVQYAGELRIAKTIDHDVRRPRSLVDPAISNANRI